MHRAENGKAGLYPSETRDDLVGSMVPVAPFA